MHHVPALNEVFCFANIGDNTGTSADQIVGGSDSDIALKRSVARLAGRRWDYMNLTEDSGHTSYLANADSLRRFSIHQHKVFAVASKLRDRALETGASDGSLGLLRDVLAGLTGWPAFQVNRAEAPLPRTGVLESWEIVLKVYGLGTSKTLTELLTVLDLQGRGDHNRTIITPRRMYDIVDQAELLLSTAGPRVCPFTEKMFRDLFTWVMQGPDAYYRHMEAMTSSGIIEKLHSDIERSRAVIDARADDTELHAILHLGRALTAMRELLPLLEYSARPVTVALDQWQKAQAMALEALGYDNDAIPTKPGLYYFEQRTTALKEYVNGSCRSELRHRKHDFGPMRHLWEKGLEDGKPMLRQIAPIVEFFALDAPSTVTKLEDYLTHLDNKGVDLFGDGVLPGFSQLQWERG